MLLANVCTIGGISENTSGGNESSFASNSCTRVSISSNLSSTSCIFISTCCEKLNKSYKVEESKLRIEELGRVQDEIVNQSRSFLIADGLEIGVVYSVLIGIRLILGCIPLHFCT